MSFRRELILNLGGFDVRFAGNGFREETDFCLRLRNRSYKIVFDPDAAILHHYEEKGGAENFRFGNSQLVSFSYHEDFFHNNLYFFLKNMPSSHWPALTLGLYQAHVASKQNLHQGTAHVALRNLAFAVGLFRAVRSYCGFRGAHILKKHRAPAATNLFALAAAANGVRGHSEQMNIGFDIRTLSFRKGGISHYAYGLLKSLTRIDQRNRYLLFGYTRSGFEWDTFRGNVREIVLRLPQRHGGRALWERVLVPFAARRWNLDIWFSPDFFVPKFVRIPRVVAIHDLIFMNFYDPESRYSRDLRAKVGYAIKHAAKIVAISQYTLEDLCKGFALDRARAAVHSPGSR